MAKNITMPLVTIHNSKFNKSSGIALIQVLLLTAILSVLGLYLTQTARDQIMVAQWLDNKASAQVAIHSAEAQLLFSLFTEPFLVASKDESNEYLNQNDNEENQEPLILRNKWNFFGHPFSVNDRVSVSIQDQAGLIHAHYPIHDVLKNLIVAQGQSEIQASIIVDHLLDWQDIDSTTRFNGNEDQNFGQYIRNGAISSIYDLDNIAVIPASLLTTLYQNLTIYHRGNFNPMNASVELIAALSNQMVAEQVNELRKNHQLDRQSFVELTAVTENDEIFMYPSSFLAITITGRVGEIKVKKSMIVEIQPNASNSISPLNILSNTH